MIRIEWSEILATGIEVIDDDHQFLVGLINQLHDEINEGETEKVLFILEGLHDYTKEHFHREETLLRLCNYDNFDEHKRSHEQISKKIENICQLYKAMPSVISLYGVQEFLADWLANHIMHEDHLYKETLLKDLSFIESLNERI